MKRAILIMVLFCFTALGTYALKPSQFLADRLTPIDLEAMVPKQFGDWHLVETGAIQVINPQAETLVNLLYQDILNRVYVNSQGYKIMLSIAYGRDQRDGMDVHKPEVCYPAQGFKLLSQRWLVIDMGDSDVAWKQLVTQLKQRKEPVTYWHMVGDQVVGSGFNKKFVEIGYALDGLIPDGMIVRASSIDADSDRAHTKQMSFLKQLRASIDHEHRSRFGG